jgi:hypothetical protein
MKQSSNIQPLPIVKISANKWHINYNIEKVTEEENIMFKFNYVKVSKLDKAIIINSIIRTKYSVSEEFSILRKQLNNIKTDEYVKYNTFVEGVKIKVKEILC